MQLLRSLLYTLSFFFSVLIFSIVAIFAGLLSYPARFAVAQSWARTNLWLLRVLCNLDYVLEGQQHIPTEPCVVAIKHQSVWEAFAMIAWFPQQCWVLKRELMWVPFLGWALALLRPIAINRRAHGTALEQVVSQGKERLRDGMLVMIFPEGTRVAPGQSRRYGFGAAALACAARVPVVPMAHNAGEFWPRRAWVKKAGTIRAVIGPPIPTVNRSREQVTEGMREWIEAHSNGESDSAPLPGTGATGNATS